MRHVLDIARGQVRMSCNPFSNKGQFAYSADSSHVNAGYTYLFRHIFVLRRDTHLKYSQIFKSNWPKFKLRSLSHSLSSSIYLYTIPALLICVYVDKCEMCAEFTIYRIWHLGVLISVGSTAPPIISST